LDKTSVRAFELNYNPLRPSQQLDPEPAGTPAVDWTELPDAAPTSSPSPSVKFHSAD